MKKKIQDQEMTLKFSFRYLFRLLYRSKHQTRGSELGIICPFVSWNCRECSKVLRMERFLSCWRLLTRFRRWTADTMMVMLMTWCTCYSCLEFVCLFFVRRKRKAFRTGMLFACDLKHIRWLSESPSVERCAAFDRLFRFDGECFNATNTKVNF